MPGRLQTQREGREQEALGSWHPREAAKGWPEYGAWLSQRCGANVPLAFLFFFLLDNKIISEWQIAFSASPRTPGGPITYTTLHESGRLCLGGKMLEKLVL